MNSINSMNSIIRHRGFLLMTKAEVVAEMIKFYSDMMPTNADMLANGYKNGIDGVPSTVIDKGLENLSLYELQTIADAWAEYKLEQVENEMKAANDIGKPPILIVMVEGNEQDYCTPYVLSSIYKEDFQVPPGVVKGYG